MNLLCLPIPRQEIGHELLTEWTEISDVDTGDDPRKTMGYLAQGGMVAAGL
jgi:hypothetical protein